MTSRASSPTWSDRDDGRELPATSSSVGTIWWVLVRSITTRVRLAGLGLLGVAAIVLGLPYIYPLRPIGPTRPGP